jgi:hypothetical protein
MIFFTNFIRSLLSVFFLVVGSSCLVNAQQWRALDDPESFGQNVLALINTGKSGEASELVARTLGANSESATALEKELHSFSGRSAGFSAKVLDKEFNGALRQIVYYSYYKVGVFAYFRFNFKNTGSGWLLANFNYRTEIQELFPDDFACCWR